MKLTHPILVRFSSLLASWLIRAWIGSLEFRFVVEDPLALPQRMETGGLYVFWHEMLLLPAHTHGDQILPVISRGKDGEIATQILSFLGGQAIRGSTDHGKKNRGGRDTAWQIIRKGKSNHIGVTVDGPVGPRRQVSAGSLVAAARHGMDVVPIGFGANVLACVGPAGRKIMLPRPFSRVWVVTGKRMQIPRNDRCGARQMVQDALEAVQLRAEQLAAGEAKYRDSLSLSQLQSL